MATSQAPYSRPHASSAAPSAGSDGTTASATISAQFGSAVAATAARLPNRRQNQPVVGIDTSAPTPGASRTSPSSAGVAWSRSRVAGSRDTQVPSSAPLTATTSAVPSAERRSRLYVSTRSAAIGGVCHARLVIPAQPRVDRRRLGRTYLFGAETDSD